VGIHSRGYRTEDDLRRLRRLLIDSFALNQTMHNWWIERFESGLYFLPDGWTQGLHLWYDDAALVGAVHPRSGTSSEVHLQIHPHYRSLEAAMVSQAEATLTQQTYAGCETISFWVYAYDASRQRLLASQGYTKTDQYRRERWRALNVPIPDVPSPNGYQIRPLTQKGDEDRMADALNTVFNTTFFTGEYYRKVQSAPSYRHDLDLAVFAHDGSIAAFATAWYHPANNIGAFEPVGTHPAHRRRGLAKRVVAAGMRRLKKLGATRVNVGTGMDPAANRFYAALGFTSYQQSFEWQKRVRY
jgi:mycothiol synthase